MSLKREGNLARRTVEDNVQTISCSLKQGMKFLTVSQWGGQFFWITQPIIGILLNTYYVTFLEENDLPNILSVLEGSNINANDNVDKEL